MTGSILSSGMDSRTSELLLELSGLLDVPVDAFREPTVRPTTLACQASDLLSDFYAITDPAARERCLAFVRALAAEAGEG